MPVYEIPFRVREYAHAYERGDEESEKLLTSPPRRLVVAHVHGDSDQWLSGKFTAKVKPPFSDLAHAGSRSSKLPIGQIVTCYLPESYSAPSTHASVIPTI
jgi:hypothetical protein